MKANIRHTPAIVMLLLTLLAGPLPATTWEWFGVDDYLRLADLIAIVEVEDVDTKHTSHGYAITSGKAKVIELIFSRWGSPQGDVRIYDLDTQVFVTQSGGETMIIQNSPWRLTKGRFFVILKGSEMTGYRPFDRLSLQSLEKNIISLEEDKVLIPVEKDAQKELQNVPSAEAAAAFRKRVKESVAGGDLLERMNAVIADPGPLEGVTAEQQFCNALQKISDRYAERWKTPLPLWIAPAVLTHLRSSLDLRHVLVTPIRDAPLPVIVRYWCGMAGVSFRIQPDGVYILPEEKP